MAGVREQKEYSAPLLRCAVRAPPGAAAPCQRPLEPAQRLPLESQGCALVLRQILAGQQRGEFAVDAAQGTHRLPNNMRPGNRKHHLLLHHQSRKAFGVSLPEVSQAVVDLTPRRPPEARRFAPRHGLERHHDANELPGFQTQDGLFFLRCAPVGHPASGLPQVVGENNLTGGPSMFGIFVGGADFRKSEAARIDKRAQ